MLALRKTWYPMGGVVFGDCRDTIRALVDSGIRVHTCITSPPYFGLRDYGTAKWEGGDLSCDHVETYNLKRDCSGGVGQCGRSKGTRGVQLHNSSSAISYRSVCAKCGAMRVDQQIGCEDTPEEYVANLVDVFRLVRDLLHDTGTLWLNLGDSYWGGKGKSGTTKGLGTAAARGYNQSRGTVVTNLRPQDRRRPFIKAKDLIGIPWRVAFALQQDGWHLRQDIIWAKGCSGNYKGGSVMPESVNDRCTKSHEYLFLLTKSKKYFFDSSAIKEDGIYPAGTRGGKCSEDRIAQKGVSTRTAEYKVFDGLRNRRSVWVINTKPYKGAHFATFPTELVIPCILAGSSEKGCCPKCGVPWIKVEASEFRPACACNVGDPVPCIVFDPFFGSGTTGKAAQDLGRRWIGCELNQNYNSLQELRLRH